VKAAQHCRFRRAQYCARRPPGLRQNPHHFREN
jgi:hypothetical protein